MFNHVHFNLYRFSFTLEVTNNNNYLSIITMDQMRQESLVVMHPQTLQ